MRLVITGQLAREAIIKRIREAPIGFEVLIREAKKSREQEQMYHAIIENIAEQFKFCERLWDKEDMKRLLLDQFRRDTPELADLWAEVAKVELAPALDGSGVVVLGIQSRRFPKKLATAFIDWLNAFAADNELEV